jgi:uncharacterized RDD family membrane protein YckC
MAELLRRIQDDGNLDGDVSAPAVGTSLTKPTDVRRPERRATAVVDLEGGISFDPEFASYASRALGLLVDAVVLALFTAPGIAILAGGGAGRLLLGIVVALLGFGAALVLYARMISRRAQSFGNLVTTTKVVDVRNGRRIGAGEAGLRYALRFTVSMILFAGFLAALGNSERRTFHDRVAGTVVIRRPRETWSIDDEVAGPPAA